MDSDFLALLALVAFWIFGRFASKKKQQQQPGSAGAPPPPDRDQASEVDPELGDALEEIRRALGMGAEAEPQPASGGGQTSAPEPLPQGASAAGPSTRTQSAGPSDEFHRVVTGRPDSEAEFERRRTYDEAKVLRDRKFSVARPLEGTRTRLQEKFSTHTDPFRRAGNAPDSPDYGFHDPLVGHDHVKAPKKATPAGETVLRLPNGRLQTRESLQEAFVLKEIVGPPRSRHRGIRD